MDCFAEKGQVGRLWGQMTQAFSPTSMSRTVLVSSVANQGTNNADPERS